MNRNCVDHQPLISVIVPVYNVEKYLERCVLSILNQTYQNLELILIDDGSSDSSGRLCEEFKTRDHRVVVIHSSNGGQSRARNVGLDRAKGEFIGFVDSDDWISPEMYSYLYSLLLKYDCDVAGIQPVHTRGEESRERKKERLQFFEGKEILEEFLYEGIKTGSYCVWKNLYRAGMLEGYRFPEGRINEDILFNYQVFSKARKIVKSNRGLYYYFQGTGSTTTSGLKKRDYDLLYICDEVDQLAGCNDSLKVRYLAKVKVARSYFSLLARITFYGINDREIDRQATVKELTRQLRKNLGILLQSPMPFNRKIMAVLLSINLKCLEIPLNIYKKIKS